MVFCCSSGVCRRISCQVCIRLNLGVGCVGVWMISPSRMDAIFTFKDVCNIVFVRCLKGN